VRNVVSNEDLLELCGKMEIEVCLRDKRLVWMGDVERGAKGSWAKVDWLKASMERGGIW